MNAPTRQQDRLPARTILVGLGSIGLAIAKAVRKLDTVEVVSAVDPAPGRAGKDLGRVLGEDASAGITIKSELEDALRSSRPRLCLLATGSRLHEVADDIFTLIGHGCSVITTAEEMANPVLHDRELAEKMDEACKRRGVVVVMAGVNPGFVMDRLVLTLAQVTRDIQRVEVTRVVDANRRRPQLLARMGGGMSPTLFAERALDGGVGHVGLRESMYLVARGLGWRLTDYRESISPEVVRETMSTPVGVLERGQIRGATQRARGYVGGEEKITFILEIAAASENPRDEIFIHGTPPVHITIPEGCSGDEATISLVASSIPFALFARPGLRLVTEVPADPRALQGLVDHSAPARPAPRKKAPAKSSRNGKAASPRAR
ncbi:MAG: hypothetical protein AB2A00_18680 [Myxococcota bacterium]